MTVRTFAFAAFLACLSSAAAAQPGAQRARPAPPAPPAAPTPGVPPLAIQPPGPPAAPAPPPRRDGQPVNVKVELTILDSRGGAAATRKTVSVVVADNMNGFIRSTSNYTLPGRVESVPLNVDVEPQIIADNKLRLRLSVQYDLPNSLASAAGGGDGQGNLFTTQLRESLAIIVESGKSIVAAQSADPVGDRQVTIEVKATILR